MVSGMVRSSGAGLRRAVWLLDNHGTVLQHFFLPGETATENSRELAACGSFEGYPYVLEADRDGVRVVRYGVE